jgi:hypothetical protein
MYYDIVPALQAKLLLVFLRSVGRLIVTANDFPRSPILVSLVMDTLRSSEASVLTTATRRIIPEEAILNTLRRHFCKILLH